MVGAIIGARDGISSIPKAWIEKIECVIQDFDFDDLSRRVLEFKRRVK
ncbi:hypothetical protein DRN72_03200 [Methanosarcinales archaeon]|nr:MAG: hypothetical protein DRN72_03200 [Methanosarcinales archaeon]